MTLLSALVGIVAGLLTILLRIREIRRGLDPGSLRIESDKGLIVDADGHPVSHPSKALPTMLIPALGLTALLQLMAITAGLVAAPAAFLAVDSPPKLAAKRQLIVLHVDEVDNLEELESCAYQESDAQIEGDATRRYEHTLSALLDFTTSVQHLTLGFILMGMALPLFFLLARFRALLFPRHVLNRSLAMGAWTGLLMGGIEAFLAPMIGKDLFGAIGVFLSKFVAFFFYGLITGVLLLLYRRISSGAFFQRVIRGSPTTD